jgi:hypothetical protein
MMRLIHDNHMSKDMNKYISPRANEKITVRESAIESRSSN